MSGWLLEHTYHVGAAPRCKAGVTPRYEQVLQGWAEKAVDRGEEITFKMCGARASLGEF